MATGRTASKHTRVYIDGYDFSGDARSIGPLAWSFEEHEFVPLTANVKGYLPGHAEINPGTLNALLDNTATTGIHAVMGAPGMRTVLVPIGIRAAPAQGDPVFCGEFEQKEYLVDPSEGSTGLTVSFEASGRASTFIYARPWGSLLHARSAETAVNSSTGIDDSPAGAATSKGGFMVYQLFTSNGTVTLKVQDAAVNVDGSFADLSGATSGAIDASSSPKSGLVALGITATVRQYTRWQLVFGTATTATFALAFVRNHL